MATSDYVSCIAFHKIRFIDRVRGQQQFNVNKQQDAPEV